MATDTAFAVALIVMMGRRVPIELRIFLTAAAIVDDIGAIRCRGAVLFGRAPLSRISARRLLVVGALALARTGRVYIEWCLISGWAGVLWLFIHEGGLHATLTGVLLALFIPTRPPPNLNALMTQANTIFEAEAEHEEVLRHGPSIPTLRALDAIHDRLESPADRMLRQVAPRSSYVGAAGVRAGQRRCRDEHGMYIERT